MNVRPAKTRGPDAFGTLIRPTPVPSEPTKASTEPLAPTPPRL